MFSPKKQYENRVECYKNTQKKPKEKVKSKANRSSNRGHSDVQREKKCHQKGASQCCYHHCCRQMMLSAYCHYGAIQQSAIDKIYGQFSSVMKTCCCKALQTVSSYNDWRQRKGFIGQCVYERARLSHSFFHAILLHAHKSICAFECYFLCKYVRRQFY